MCGISWEERVEAVKNIPQERTFARRCQQSEVIDVPEISAEERSRLKKLGVFFRMWTWTSERATMARLRRKYEVEPEKPEVTVLWNEAGLLRESCRSSSEGE